jgi:formylglycine-generating enzyme required for sulfatase activity
MFRNCPRFIAVMILILFLAACGKKEESPESAETPSAQDTAPIPETPAITPGEMVLIPAGEFILGDNTKGSQANPQQKVNLPAFWIDKYEITNREFLDFSIKTGYQAEGASEGKDWRTFFTTDKADFPVVYITWKDADSYCKASGKRLPTEPEWEKAARGTDGRIYAWGNEWKPGQTNTYETDRAPAAIGKYSGDVSPYGVHDMVGNVMEWTSSWYLPYKGNSQEDPNFGQRFRVVRGASSRSYGDRYRLWMRSAYLPNSLYDFGFRCAKDAEEPAGK